MTILEALKIRTAAQHERVEALMPLTDAGLTLARYAAVLRAFHALYAALEPALVRALAADEPAGWRRPDFDVGARRKLPRLERDLAWLGAGVGAEPPADVPPLGGVAEALGALYVVEGATLGGRVIQRHLARRLGVTPERGGAFFAGYGERTGTMWTAYRAQVTDFVARVGEADAVLAGAVATFDVFERRLAGLATAAAETVGA